ncbi:DUF4810 domain-containing protein [Ideonella sp. A 288]|uniref:DUF4810 domain-containing protein n=1 Tax=Ideonella sp. A 288 TaxID=1962181 RepID=UPI000B4AF313|nr:DUF4810 domain-containing protein [Ideonella sp. A 288]
MHATTTLRRAAVWGLVLTLSACATPTKPIYQWGGYQSALYNYLKGNVSDPGAQIQQLEAQAQRTLEAGAATPPGLHGHLALLYSKVGDDANALRHLEAERKLFPESAAYIDFLLKRAAKPASKS